MLTHGTAKKSVSELDVQTCCFMLPCAGDEETLSLSRCSMEASKTCSSQLDLATSQLASGVRYMPEQAKLCSDLQFWLGIGMTVGHSYTIGVIKLQVCLIMLLKY